MIETDYDVDAIRGHFPIFREKQSKDRPFIYFDSAATSQKPKCMVDTLSNFYLREYSTVHRAVYETAAKATERYCLVREKIKDYISATYDDEIVFTKGTTQSLNIIARSYAAKFLKDGDEIIISSAEHHSNILPWQILAEEKNLRLRIAPVDQEGRFDLEAFKEFLSEKTKLVSVAYMTNTTGVVFPVKEIARLAHHVGAVIVVDAAQAAPHMAIDVEDLDIDFMAFSAHKMYGPTGLGILYGKKALLEKMDPYEYGGDMVTNVTFEEATFQKAPLKFEAGTPMLAQVIAFGASIDFIQEISREKIADWETKLLKKVTRKLKEIDDVQILGDFEEKGPVVTFSVKGSHSLDLGTLLNLKGIALRTGQMCAQPAIESYNLSTATRVSFGMYNTYDEIDFFISSLKEALILLRPALSSF